MLTCVYFIPSKEKEPIQEYSLHKSHKKRIWGDFTRTGHHLESLVFECLNYGGNRTNSVLEALSFVCRVTACAHFMALVTSRPLSCHSNTC